MTEPLWTDTYAPSLADISQDDVREYLDSAVDGPINMVFYGPPGAGKTAAVRALATEAHDDPDNDLIEINVADVFDMTKKEITNDPRFSNFIDSKRRRNSSKSDLINHVLKESASYSPMSGSYKTIVLDNAEGIREDFQQALRRVMEQYHESTQFIITTRQPAKLIAPIKSRCFPVAFRNPTPEELGDILRFILDAEDISYTADGIEYIAGYSDGNIREAVLSAQTVAKQEDEVTGETAFDVLDSVGVHDRVESMLKTAADGDFTDARKTLDDLLVDDGYSGEEVLDAIREVAFTTYYTDPEQLREFAIRAADLDMDLADGSSARIQLGQLLAELGAEA